MIPAARDKVRIRGRSDEYFVLAVDRELECAYVVESRGHGYVEMVRLQTLVPTGDQPPSLQDSLPQTDSN